MEAVPPGLRYRVRDVLGLVADGTLEGVARERMTRLLEDGEPWLGADPGLAEVGYWMLEARNAGLPRRHGASASIAREPARRGRARRRGLADADRARGRSIARREARAADADRHARGRGEARPARGRAQGDEVRGSLAAARE